MKKSVKIAIIAVVSIVVIILIVGSYFFINDVTQKGKLLGEIAQIEELTNSGNFDMTELDKKTSIIVTNGKYATVEKAVKNYASDLFNTAFKIRAVLEDDNMTKLLAAENYEKDGPEFVETKKYLAETKKKLEEGKKEILAYLEESKLNSYIEAETTDEYYINLYKELITEDIEMSEQERNEIEESMNAVESILNIEEEIIDFLIANKGKWKVQGGQVLFYSNALVETYNGLLSKLQ